MPDKKKKAAKRRYKPYKYPFKQMEVIFFDPPREIHPKHPLSRNERCYYMGEIPNVPGHCLVFSRESGVVDMVHPEDFRKAKEEEL